MITSSTDPGPEGLPPRQGSQHKIRDATSTDYPKQTNPKGPKPKHDYSYSLLGKQAAKDIPGNQYERTGHAQQCVKKYLEHAKKDEKSLTKVSTPCIDDHELHGPWTEVLAPVPGIPA